MKIIGSGDTGPAARGAGHRTCGRGTPHRCQALTAQLQLLEVGANGTVDLIAERAGFGNSATFRHHFRAWRATTPHACRRTFRESQPGSLAS